MMLLIANPNHVRGLLLTSLRDFSANLDSYSSDSLSQWVRFSDSLGVFEIYRPKRER